MAKYEKTVYGDFKTIVNKLDDEIVNSGISMQLVDTSYFETGDTNVKVLIYDKYFMRNSSRASLSVTVVGSDDTIFISAIGSGGGQGAFFNFSWGAEEDILRSVEDCITKMHREGTIQLYKQD